MPSRAPRLRGRLDALLASDPRLDHEYVRVHDTPVNPVVLVGVVHDHPASEHRVRTLVDAVSPATVALELPGVVVPALATASDADEPPGGEMAAAIPAAGDAEVVGIDLPGRGTLGALVRELGRRDVSLRTASRSLRVVGRLLGHAVLSRLGHAGVPGVPTLSDLEPGHDYDLPADASPREQATHEAAHVRRSTTLLRAFEPPPATQFLDAVRERQMADALRTLAERGPVVAVVGYGHLAGLTTHLEKSVDA